MLMGWDSFAEEDREVVGAADCVAVAGVERAVSIVARTNGEHAIRRRSCSTSSDFVWKNILLCAGRQRQHPLRIRLLEEIDLVYLDRFNFQFDWMRPSLL